MKEIINLNILAEKYLSKPNFSKQDFIDAMVELSTNIIEMCAENAKMRGQTEHTNKDLGTSDSVYVVNDNSDDEYWSIDSDSIINTKNQIVNVNMNDLFVEIENVVIDWKNDQEK